MTQDKSAVESFLEDTKDEKSPFATDKQELFTESVKTPVKEEEEEGEKPLPFHKDPKVQRYVQKQIDKALQSIPKPSAVEEFRNETKGAQENFGLPESFVELVGNDTPQKQRVLKDLSQYLGSLEEKGAQRALQELGEQAEAQKQEDINAQNELDTGFEEIEETFNVDLSSNAPSARKTRAEFVDFVRKIAPKNEEGEVIAFPDLPAAFEEYQERSKKPSQQATRAKELASRSMGHSSDTTAKPTVGNSWKEVEKLFSRLN